jgi:hypothetical protein
MLHLIDSVRVIHILELLQRVVVRTTGCLRHPGGSCAVWLEELRCSWGGGIKNMYKANQQQLGLRAERCK